MRDLDFFMLSDSKVKNKGPKSIQNETLLGTLPRRFTQRFQNLTIRYVQSFYFVHQNPSCGCPFYMIHLSLNN